MNNLFNENIIRKKVITYEGSIGPKKNSYMALEKRLKELINSGEVGVVPGSFSERERKNQSIFQHLKSGIYLLYESFPSSYGRDEDLFMVFDSRKSSSKDLEKCEEWIHNKFEGFLIRL